LKGDVGLRPGNEESNVQLSNIHSDIPVKVATIFGVLWLKIEDWKLSFLGRFSVFHIPQAFVLTAPEFFLSVPGCIFPAWSRGIRRRIQTCSKRFATFCMQHVPV